MSTRTKQASLLCLVLFSPIVGLPLLLAGLLRLGWGRHGAGAADPSFLHLDWVLQPSLPFWSAHLSNLGPALTGFIFLGVAGISLVLLVVGWRRSTREK